MLAVWVSVLGITALLLFGISRALPRIAHGWRWAIQRVGPKRFPRAWHGLEVPLTAALVCLAIGGWLFLPSLGAANWIDAAHAQDLTWVGGWLLLLGSVGIGLRGLACLAHRTTPASPSRPNKQARRPSSQGKPKASRGTKATSTNTTKPATKKRRA